MPEDRLFEAEADDSGKRLDVFLAERLEEISRSAIQRWIEAGLATIDGRVGKPRSRVSPGNQVRVSPPLPPPWELVAEEIPLQIVFEDESLIVIDKPAGLVVHPGAGNRQGTLANALAHHFQTLSGQGGIRPGIVHRLDKLTSGLLVVAKNDLVHERLALQFKSREVDKLYLALVHGQFSKPRGRIDSPLGRHPKDRVKMSTRSRKPRAALTEYEVLRVFSSGFSYLQVKLHTGRTHQIRVHCEHIGHPIVGDAVYGAAGRENQLKGEIGKAVRELGRHFLHAACLVLRHPVQGQRMEFRSPLPGRLADLLERLG